MLVVVSHERWPFKVSRTQVFSVSKPLVSQQTLMLWSFQSLVEQVVHGLLDGSHVVACDWFAFGFGFERRGFTAGEQGCHQEGTKVPTRALRVRGAWHESSSFVNSA